MTKIINLIASIFLARILTPSDFGFYGLVLTLLSFMVVFDEMGLKNAVIQSSEPLEKTLYIGFAWKLIFAFLTLCFSIIFLAPWGAHFYEQPELQLMITGVALAIFCDTGKFMPSTYFIKNHLFGKLVFPSLLRTFSYSFLVILFAYLGHKYWSFLYARTLSCLAEVIFLALIFPWTWKISWKGKEAQKLLKFSFFVLIAAFLGVISNSMDNLVVAKLLGFSALGHYTVAYRWGGVLAIDLGIIINEVLYPINVQYQNQAKTFERIQYQSMKYSALLMLPLSFGFAATCPEFVRLILGEKWIPSIIPLQILSLYNLLLALEMRGNIFLALGKPQYASWLALIYIFFLGIMIVPFTLAWGIIGTSLAALIAKLFRFTSFWLMLKPLLSFSPLSILKTTEKPFLATLVMTIAILLTKSFLYWAGVSPWFILIAMVIWGAGIYAFVIYLLMKEEVLAVWTIFKEKGLSNRERLERIILSL